MKLTWAVPGLFPIGRYVFNACDVVYNRSLLETFFLSKVTFFQGLYDQDLL